MARPLQKKKNKSSLPRVRQKPKSKRINIKSHPLVAAHWDRRLTLSQNYHRLGLTSKLNAHSGGTEKKVTDNKLEDVLAIPSSRGPKELGTEEVKVVRDPVTGAIVSVESDEREQRKRRNPLGDPLNEISDEGEDGAGDEVEEGRGIVPELEQLAKWEKQKRPRWQSEREQDWCRRLVERWGDDWGAMFRDKKLNPMQQSEGDLRKRVELWKTKRRPAVEEGWGVED